jgi:hypothetical protein
MPAKQLDGRIAQAELIAAQPIYLAWGTGNPAWDELPEPEPVDVTALVAEIGRRLATQVGYVLPDPGGAIETPQGNFALSVEPTRYLYVRTVFGFDDAPDAHIRELGLFIGSVPVDGLPEGQRYFAPAEIAQSGRMLLLDRSQNFQRNGAVRPAFEYVMPF